jgi:hypothetical protein
MVERLERLALDFGMPVSTMGAFAIGSWINQQEQSRSNSAKAIHDVASAMAQQMGQQLENLDPEQLANTLHAAITKSTSMALLDHEAAPNPAVGVR